MGAASCNHFQESAHARLYVALVNGSWSRRASTCKTRDNDGAVWNVLDLRFHESTQEGSNPRVYR